MRRVMLTRVLLLGSTLVLVACSAAVPSTPPTGTSPSPLATNSAATPPKTAAPTSASASAGSAARADVHRWSSAASENYDGLAEWARMLGGNLALVRVVEVGPVRWNSPTGTRPDEAELHRGPAEGETTYFIGRLITVQLERVIRGRWLPATDTARYWRPGGAVGADVLDTAFPVPEFQPGDRAIAFIVPKEVDLGRGGPLPVQIGSLFPVDSAGRILTLDPAEQVTLDTIDSVLRQGQ